RDGSVGGFRHGRLLSGAGGVVALARPGMSRAARWLCACACSPLRSRSTQSRLSKVQLGASKDEIGPSKVHKRDHLHFPRCAGECAEACGGSGGTGPGGEVRTDEGGDAGGLLVLGGTPGLSSDRRATGGIR